MRKKSLYTTLSLGFTATCFIIAASFGFFEENLKLYVIIALSASMIALLLTFISAAFEINKHFKSKHK